MSDATTLAAPPLAAEFPSASEDDWRKRVEAMLKGADFEKKLVSRTADGMAIAPLYSSDSALDIRRPEQTPWTVTQRADHPDTARANEQALDDLNHGATGLHLVFAEAPGAYGFGLTAFEPRSIGRLMANIRIDAIDLSLHAGARGMEVAGAFAQWVATQPVDPERLRVSFGLDPIGSGAIENFAEKLRGAVKSLREQHFAGPFANAAGVVWHDAGASEVQELAFAIATGVAYLRALDHLDDKHLQRTISLTLAADQDMFVTLAKFRAARLLWSRVLAASGLRSDAITLAGETSWRMMTALDAHTNILRTTAAVFAAALGGADRIAVLPFSLAQGLPDEFARRIARNTQTILQEESQLWRVSDPASGSGYVEHLTQALCDKAWPLFQEIEKAGGMVAAIESGHIASLVAAKHQEKLARIESKAETIIGVTAYKPPREAVASIEDVSRDITSAPRLAETFETVGASA